MYKDQQLTHLGCVAATAAGVDALVRVEVDSLTHREMISAVVAKADGNT